MKVLIEDNLYIEGDHQNIEVRRYKKNKKTGKEEYKTLGYFPNVERALEKVYDTKLSETKATNLEELLIEVKSIKQWLKEKMGYKG